MTTDAERNAQKARQRAYRRLAAAHAEEFERLFTDERTALGIKPGRILWDWCVHCDLDRPAYSDGLCRICKQYEYRTGQRPSPKVIRARTRRREEQRWAS